jgi:hypothetical protein
MDAQMRFRHPLAGTQCRLALVAGARIDAVEDDHSPHVRPRRLTVKADLPHGQRTRMMRSMDTQRIIWTVAGVVIGIVVFAIISRFTGYESWMVPLGAGLGAGIAITLDINRRKNT